MNKTLDKHVGNVFSAINESASKLRYYPYTVIEMSDGRGNVVNYKPEGLKSVNGTINLTFLGSIYFTNWVAYAMQGYNKNGKLTKEDKNEVENGKIKWQKNKPQEYIVTYIYSAKVYENIKDHSK